MARACEGRVALVAGASQGGTGTGSAVRLAAEGAKVAICARSVEKLAETLGLHLDRVSVKFKTAERLGPVGEGLSAEAQAVVLLSR